MHDTSDSVTEGNKDFQLTVGRTTYFSDILFIISPIHHLRKRESLPIISSSADVALSC